MGSSCGQGTAPDLGESRRLLARAGDFLQTVFWIAIANRFLFFQHPVFDTRTSTRVRVLMLCCVLFACYPCGVYLSVLGLSRGSSWARPGVVWVVCPDGSQVCLGYDSYPPVISSDPSDVVTAQGACTLAVG